MFETSMVLARPRPARSRIGLLTASILAHTVAVVGVVAVSLASTDFPAAAPDESAVFMPVAPPPPLGNLHGGAPPKPKPAAVPPVQKQQTPAPPSQITAPPEVPNETPVLEAPSSGGDSTATGPAGEGTVEGPIGVPWGDPNGVGDLDAPPAPVAAEPVEEKIYTPGIGEVKAPVLIHKVDPAYPEIMRRTGMSTRVVVKCVIDKNGRVRDPEIVVGSLPPFNDAVMRAIHQWRYQPGSLRGNAVETYLHLTVTFNISR